jgi:hypothetical protein
MTDLFIVIKGAIKITIPIMVGVTIFTIGYVNKDRNTGLLIMGVSLISMFSVLYLFTATTYLDTI